MFCLQSEPHKNAQQQCSKEILKPCSLTPKRWCIDGKVRLRILVGLSFLKLALAFTPEGQQHL
jgi:hypothetical protein